MQNEGRKKTRTVVSILLSVLMLCSVITVGTTTMTADSATSEGLTAHCLRAYNEGWAYVWGGMSEGAVDCTGMIAMYNGVGGVRTDMVSSSQSAGLDWGYVDYSSYDYGIPRIHGLGLHKPGHVGLYVGSGMEIDARGTNWGVCYGDMDELQWVEWYKIVGVDYPTNGWFYFDGDYFYYENGQYIVNTSRTIGGVDYSFDYNGYSNKKPNSTGDTDYSGDSSSSSSSYLKVGSQGSKVEEIQKMLKTLGYFDDDISGYYGTYTAACVKEFQEDYDIEVDGVVGPEFLSTIKAAIDAKDDAADTSDDDTDSSEEATQAPTAAPTQEETDTVTEEATEEATVEATEEATQEDTEEATEAVTEEATEAPTEAPTPAPTEAVTFVPTEAPTEAPTSDGTLRYGDAGSDITALQNRLTELGYYNSQITAVFDDNTLNALHAYFNASELRQNDEITKAQLETLYSSLAVAAPKTITASTAEGEDVADIQDKLVTLGYMDTKTGTYDANTETAVKVAQSNFAMEVTGQADDEFVEALDMEATRQSSQVVENATVKTSNSKDVALAALSADDFNTVSHNSDNGSVTMIWVAGIMFALAGGAMIAYLKHRKTRAKSNHAE
ncbi:MAG TPA: hypothetical protein GX401_04780 [Clostridiales bacterium]|nr:hypothetical protein [Clostridiales bacterium]